MREEDVLLSKADQLVSDFTKTDTYLLYKKLKQEVDSNERLNHLIESRKALQKGLRYRDTEKKRTALKAAQDLQDEFDNDPLVINLKAQEQEVKDRISILTEEKF